MGRKGCGADAENEKNKKRKKNRGLRKWEVLREWLRKQEVESEKVELESERVLA